VDKIAFRSRHSGQRVTHILGLPFLAIFLSKPNLQDQPSFADDTLLRQGISIFSAGYGFTRRGSSLQMISNGESDVPVCPWRVDVES
jgi:hypothetical protein